MQNICKFLYDVKRGMDFFGMFYAETIGLRRDESAANSAAGSG
jgi:hypothetical protein